MVAEHNWPDWTLWKGFYEAPEPNTRMPGGGLVSGFGGFIEFITYTRTTSSGNSGDATVIHIDENINTGVLNIANYHLQIEYLNRRHAISGGHGAMSRRTVAADWYADIDIYYNADVPQPNLVLEKLRNKSAFGVKLWLGFPGTYYDLGLDYEHHYQAPLCTVGHWGTTNKSLGVIRQNIRLLGDSCMWLLTSTADEELYDAYLQAIGRRIPGD